MEFAKKMERERDWEIFRNPPRISHNLLLFLLFERLTTWLPTKRSAALLFFKQKTKEKKKKGVQHFYSSPICLEIWTKKKSKDIWFFNLEIPCTLFFYSFYHHTNWLLVTWRKCFLDVFQTALKRIVGDVFLFVLFCFAGLYTFGT